MYCTIYTCTFTEQIDKTMERAEPTQSTTDPELDARRGRAIDNKRLAHLTLEGERGNLQWATTIMNTTLQLLLRAAKVEWQTQSENETRGVAEDKINREISSLLDKMTITKDLIQRSVDRIEKLQQIIQTLDAVLNMK